MSEANFFYNPNLIQGLIDFYKREYQIEISEEFFKIADPQLRIDFESKTGLKINRHISMASPVDGVVTVENGISSVEFKIYVNHNWPFVKIKWASKSGKIYQTNDANIDPEDIQFWFEGIDAKLFHEMMFPNEQFPFKLKDLSFDLALIRLCQDACVSMQLVDGMENKDGIISAINDFIAQYNEKSEKAKRFVGVVHSWNTSFTNESTILLKMDLGSAHIIFYKHLLKFLSAKNCFKRIEID